MATPTQKPCKFGDMCHRADCRFTHPRDATPAVAAAPHTMKPCRFGSKCHRADCHYVHPPVFVAQPIAEEEDDIVSVDAEPILSNEELAARNPAFAAALAAGLALNEQTIYAGAILAQVYDDMEEDELELAALDDLVDGSE